MSVKGMVISLGGSSSTDIHGVVEECVGECGYTITAGQNWSRDKGDGGSISARPVKRLSVQQREHHTIDSTNLAQSSMR